jgi:two-component sensor histidine kinase/CheY-like chemotaxis protein
MAELDHRVRNILASIRSMATMTSRGASAKAEYVESLRGRLDSMARAHALLTRQKWKGASLVQLLRDELDAYASKTGSVVLDGEGDWILRAQQAQNFALVIHELATNAAKYGALSVPTGRVSVTWTIDMLGEPPLLRIVWQESGGPPVSPPESQGFGSRLILNAFRQDEGAQASLDFLPTGVRCVFNLPVWRAPAPAQASEASGDPAAAARRREWPQLRGARVLLVEDELLIGLEMRHMLATAGCEVIGPATTAAEAVRLAEESRPSAAVLDINLGGDMIDPVAVRLAAWGVPFLFVTGYDSRRVLPEGLRSAPVLRKPVEDEALLDTLQSLLAGRARAADGEVRGGSAGSA